MKPAIVLTATTLLASTAAFPQAADPAAKLAQAKACLACHTSDKKLVGPSYKEVAAKYAGNKDATNLLVTKIMKGGSGVWGPVPMPPQALSDAEAHTLVAWILKHK